MRFATKKRSLPLKMASQIPKISKMIFAPYISTPFVFYDKSNSNEYLQSYSPSKVEISNFFPGFLH